MITRTAAQGCETNDNLHSSPRFMYETWSWFACPWKKCHWNLRTTRSDKPHIHGYRWKLIDILGWINLSLPMDMVSMNIPGYGKLWMSTEIHKYHPRIWMGMFVPLAQSPNMRTPSAQTPLIVNCNWRRLKPKSVVSAD